MKWSSRYLMALALGLAGCGGGSNATYYKVAVGQAPTPQGTDCPGAPNPAVTLTGIDGDGLVGIYAEPGGGYLLDTGSGTGYEGSLAAGVYTFAGTETVSTTGNDSITTTTKTTIVLTPSGPGFTGSWTVEYICNNNTSTAACGAGCGLAICSSDSNAFDCHTTAGLVGSQVTGIVQQSPQAPASSF